MSARRSGSAGCPASCRRCGGCRRAITRRAVGARYSALSMMSVGAIAFSGIGMLIHYVGSVEAMYGTAYGMMLGTKITLFLGLLALGYGNFRVVRGLATNPSGSVMRLRRFAEVELGVGITIFFVAASMTSLPPAIDLTRDRVSLTEIAQRLVPQWPSLTSPSRDSLAFYRRAEDARRGKGGEQAADAAGLCARRRRAAAAQRPRHRLVGVQSPLGRHDRPRHGHPGPAREDRKGAVGAALAAAAGGAGRVPVPALRGGRLADRQPDAGGIPARSRIHPAQGLHGADDQLRRCSNGACATR